MTRQDIERALDAGRLFARTRNGGAWRCRRNGRTKTWKTRPDHFSVPFKAGFRDTGRISHEHLACFDDHFVIRD